jgi:RNA polymerase sigma factor (sigma-70 family)
MTLLVDQFSKERLSPEAEAELARRIKRGDVEAQQQLVLSAMREALLYTARVCRNSIREDERVSLCYRALCKCAKRFDPKWEVRFFAYSKAALRGCVQEHWKTQMLIPHFRKSVSLDVLAEGVPEQTGQTQYEDTEDPRDIHLLESTQAEGSFPKELNQSLARDKWRAIETLVAHRLNDRQREVISLTYEVGLNFNEIARLFSLTRARIQELHQKAIRIIRNECFKHKQFAE